MAYRLARLFQSRKFRAQELANVMLGASGMEVAARWPGARDILISAFRLLIIRFEFMHIRTQLCVDWETQWLSLRVRSGKQTGRLS
jgi:hypothetical protein